MLLEKAGFVDDDNGDDFTGFDRRISGKGRNNQGTQQSRSIACHRRSTRFLSFGFVENVELSEFHPGFIFLLLPAQELPNLRPLAMGFDKTPVSAPPQEAARFE